jgi:hypothetical protein
MSSTPEYRTYNVTAVYPDMQSARLGVEALEERGIEAGDIFLSGSAARQASRDADTAQRDRASGSLIGRSATRGVLVGLVLGAVLGVVVGLGLTDDVGGVLASGAGFAAMGAGLGFFVGLLSRGKISGPYEETFDDASGSVVVGVHTHDESAYEKAGKALSGTHPELLRRFDGDGNDLT